MGLFTENKLGVRYEILNCNVRTWHIDRHDIYMDYAVDFERKFRHKERVFPTAQERKENMLDHGFIEERCEIGRNERDSNPNFILNIHENREWDVEQEGWVPDGRFVLDFDWPYDSDADGTDTKECLCDAADIKKLADFINDFLKSQNAAWGASTTTNQTKIDHNYKSKYEFNSKYIFNYYIEDRIKEKEKIDFNIAITRYNFRFKAFKIKIPFYQLSKKINSLVDLIMSPVQLKEFANFLYSVLN